MCIVHSMSSHYLWHRTLYEVTQSLASCTLCMYLCTLCIALYGALLSMASHTLCALCSLWHANTSVCVYVLWLLTDLPRRQVIQAVADLWTGNTGRCLGLKI